MGGNGAAWRAAFRCFSIRPRASGYSEALSSRAIGSPLHDLHDSTTATRRDEENHHKFRTDFNFSKDFSLPDPILFEKRKTLKHAHGENRSTGITNFTSLVSCLWWYACSSLNQSSSPSLPRWSRRFPPKKIKEKNKNSVGNSQPLAMVKSQVSCCRGVIYLLFFFFFFVEGMQGSGLGAIRLITKLKT